MINFHHEISMFHNAEDVDRCMFKSIETETNLPFRLVVGDSFKYHNTAWTVVDSTYCLDTGTIFINAILK